MVVAGCPPTKIALRGIVHRFWNLALHPLVEATSPSRILEIGAESGENTRRLLSWASEHGAVVESIDPDPRFSVTEWQERFSPHLVFHRQLSLEALPEIDAVDLALIDGDHNWYTVINELRLIDRGEFGPVVALHDVDWPYGRRDLYYQPHTIPEEYRQEYAQAPIRPGQEGLDTWGLNAHLCNAITHGGPRNGVRTAIEDFCAESPREWRFFDLPGLHGLGIIASQRRLDQNQDLASLLAELERPGRLRAVTHSVEEHRLESEIRLAEARERAERYGEEIRTLREQRSHLRDQLATQNRRSRDLSVRLEAVQTDLRRTVKRHERELEVIRGKLAYERAVRQEASDLARRIGEAASWRWGHRVFAFLRLVTFRRSRGTDAVTRLRQRLDSVVVEPEGGNGAAPASGSGPSAGPGPRRRPTRSSAAEIIARQHFTARLAALWPSEHLTDRLSDPLAIPAVIDRRGALSTGADPTGGLPTVDVVVCVHDALKDTRLCLWSLTARASYPFHLIVVDDGSAAETASALQDIAAANPAIDLIRHDGPDHGYTLAANLGLRRSTADYVVLLNSDTVVTAGWLERLVACGESDPRIGVVGPISNAAGHQSVPRVREAGAWAANALPAWLTEEGMAAIVSRLSPRERPRIPFINGFCYVIKRAALERVGLFDEEHFAGGYCEENDFSYRALQAGFDLAVADDAYVFHAKSRSYSQRGRNERAKPNYQVFLDKHGRARIEELVRGLEENRALGPLREAVQRATASPDRAGAVIAGDEPLRVMFLLPGISPGGSGGTHSIYQEVRGLRELGVPATIALPDSSLAAALWAYEDAAETFETFTDLDELAAITAEAQVIVATHFKSVALLAHLRGRRGDFLPAYYIQDYEPFIVLEDHPDHEEVTRSYTAVPDALLFAKTHWLCNVVGQVHQRDVAKVEPSIDSALFHPTHRDPDTPLRVVAMVRPRTPRRQPAGTVAILERLRREHGERVQTITFGCELDELADITAETETLQAHRGILKRHQVAELLGGADVFLDFSSYQAFGRTALEAMACGCTAIVPRLGGAAEFAVHGHNSLVVDTASEETTYEALVELATQTEWLRRLQSAAADTASRYSISRAALSEYVLFQNEHARRMGAMADLDPQRASR